MIIWLITCVSVCALSVLLSGIVIPQILLIAFKRKLFDEPDVRKIHTSLVPRLGGFAFAPVVMFAIVFLLGLSLVFKLGLSYSFIENGRALAFGFCAVNMLYLVGMADDLIGIKYRAKFVMQILCGLMFIGGDIWLDNLHGLLFIGEFPQWIGSILTIFIVVYIVNAINLIDGIDGLASGLSGIAFLYYGLVYYYIGEYVYAMVAFSYLGVLIPFFYYNVFGNADRQKKIFMGDTGSLTIGVALGFLGIKLASLDNLSIFGDDNGLILAFAPLIVPCFDVVRVYLQRVRNGKNPFLPDKNHIHHKLLAVGMPQRKAMVTIITYSVALTAINVWLSSTVNINILLVADMILWILVNIWLSRKAREREKKMNAAK